jgi:urease accessory protein
VPVGHPAARVGGARIELIREDGETRLGAGYQQVPLRFMPPFSLDDEPAALLYLLTLTAGLMDGDAHLVTVDARPGAHAVVTGQSATRVHPAVSSFASQRWDVTVGDDACLVVLPGPTIPYAGARYYQRGRAELAPTARLIWGDLWLAGRYARGALSEHFAFERIVQDFEVRRAGRLVYRDRFRWDGPWTPEEAAWHFGDGLAAGCLFLSEPLATPLPTPDPATGLRQAVSTLDTGVTCIRWCGPPPAVTTALVAAALGAAGAWTSGPGARPWLLHSSDLSPNHWFSTPPR